jgi:hypothetical protein
VPAGKPKVADQSAAARVEPVEMNARPMHQLSVVLNVSGQRSTGPRGPMSPPDGERFISEHGEITFGRNPTSAFRRKARAALWVSALSS